MSHVGTEIASQPDCWRAAAERAAEVAGLPRPGERVAVIGCGTSYYIAQAYARLREDAGQGETDAWPASEFPAHRGYQRVLAITRSGTTTEVLDALRALPAGAASTVITTDLAHPVVALATDTVLLDFADEQSVVQTRFATTALALLRAHLGQDVRALADQAELALAQPLPEGATSRTQFTFLGTGWSIGIANEAGLKLREASQSWAESYFGKEYRHGPISIADERSLVWVLGERPEGLVEDVAATGAQVQVAEVDPQVELVRIQRLAVELAAARGLDPDQPRNLTRSVILA